MGVRNDLNPVDPDKTVFNFCNYNLSPRLRILLAFGLDFGMPTFKLDFFRYFLKLETLLYSLTRDGSVDSIQSDDFRKNLQFLANKYLYIIFNKYLYNFKPFKIFSAIITISDILELKILGKNIEVIVCRPDKGRGVILLNRHTYINKMLEIVSDKTKFSEVNESIQQCSMKIEDRINNF